MLESLISFLASVIMHSIQTFGYFGIFVTMTLESALIPLPSEIIMPFSGFLVSEGQFNFILVVLAGAFGNLVGSIAVYMIGFWGEEGWVRKFVRGWGRILISEEELLLGEKWFRKYGNPIVFGSRLLPVIRTYISLPCGMAKVPFRQFCILTFIGSFFWSLLLAYIGLKLGENWQFIEPIFRKFDALIIVAGIIILVLYIVRKVKKFNYAKENTYS